MAQSSEYKLPKRFDQNVEITGNLTVSGTLSGGTDTNYYLDGITKSGNTLTFSVNGATNQTYTFGSNAFTSYTDHSTQGYITDITTQTDPKYLRSNADDTTSGNITISKASAIINMGYQGGPHGINFYDDDGSTLKWGFYYRTTPDTITFETGGSSAKFTLDTSGNLTVTGTLSASGYNKSNWDTAYGWGNHASAGYLTSAREDNGNEIGSATDLNTLIDNGLYGQNSNSQATTANNYPTTAAGILETLNDPGNGYHTSQMYFKYNANNDIFHRYRYDSSGGNGGWSDWAQIWTSRTDGSGSGLDADLLDGQQGSYYQPASSAITTSNIGSQSVSNADTVDSLQASQFLRSDANDETTGYLRVTGASTNTTGVVLGTYTGGTSLSASEVVLGSGGKTGWGDGDEFGAIRWYNTDGSGIGARDAAKIVALNTQGNGTTTTTFNGELAFYTSAYNATATEKVRIDDAGNLGIGQTSPQSLLHVGNGSGVILSAGSNTWADTTVLSNGWTSGVGDWLKIEVPSADNEGGFIQLNSNGNVGIGTASPAAPLHVSNQSGLETLRLNRQTGLATIKGDTSSGATHLIIDSASGGDAVWLQNYNSGNVYLAAGGGSVGIGTSSPGEKLDVNGRVKIGDVNYAYGGSNYHILLAENDQDGYISNINGITMMTAGGYYYGASLRQLNSGSTSYCGIWTRPSGDISFETATGGTAGGTITATEKVRISASGDMGIGTTSPDQKLEVVGNAHIDYSLLGRGMRSANRGELHLNATGATDVSEIFFGYGDGYTENNIRWGISDRGTTSGLLNFYVGPAVHSSGAFTTAMTLNASGYLGINQTAPLYPLDVTGNARITGNLYLGDIIYHNGDTNTYVRFPAADDFQIVVGGKEVFRCDEGTDPDILKLGNDRVRIYMAGGTGSTEDGTLHAKGDVYAYSTLTTSDISLKENIKPIENALDIVNKLKGVTFDWKKDGTKSLGYIAQDVEEILPEMVKEVPNWDNKETHKTVNYAAMVAILSEAIKEQQKQIEELKSIIYKS